MPKYAALIYGVEGGEPSPEEQQQVYEEYMEFGQKVYPNGIAVGGEALHDSTTATTIEVKGGKGGDAVFTDGPFAETKEVLGGFYLLECEDLDEALKWAQQIPGAWHGKVEVRPVMEFDND